MVKDLESTSRLASAGTVLVVLPEVITVGTTLVPNSLFSRAINLLTIFEISTVALIPFSGSKPACAALP